MISPPENQAKKILPSQILIRRMREEHVTGIMTIESVSFGMHHWSGDSFLQEMNNQAGRYYTLVNKTDGSVIGYCGYWLILDEAHVTTVAVHPDYRGNSLGEVLLTHMLERCMGQSVKWFTLEVRVTNYSAQNLYYKYGFLSAGVRPGYYQDNREDALIMTTPDITSPEFRELFKKNKSQLFEKIGDPPEGFGT